MRHISETKQQPHDALIGGRYELVRELGRGGFGVVYACHDRTTGQSVALKTFQSHLLSKRGAREDFLREGSIWVNLGWHLHIVRAHRVENFDFGQSVYLVLDLIAGIEGRPDASLRHVIHGASCTIEQVLRYGLHIARGMRHATTVYPDLVHRDLKPENILVGRDGVARITDFGLAGSFSMLRRASELPQEQIAAQFRQVRAGTLLYMAPEHCANQQIDCRSDIYAFGCILYEMLTGQTALLTQRYKTQEDVFQAHIQGLLNPIPSAVNPYLRSFLAACLATDPVQRPRTWAEVEAGLIALFPRLLGRHAPAPLSDGDETRVERIAVAWSHKALGCSYFDMGNFDQAQHCFEHILTIGHLENDALVQGCGYAQLARLAAARGQHSEAVLLADQAYDFARSCNDQAGEAAIFSNLGLMYQDAGRPRQAAACFSRALAVAERLNNLHEQATIRNNLGLALRTLGDWEQALAYFTAFYTITRHMGDHRGQCVALGNIGSTLNELGDARAALPLLQEQLVMAERNSLFAIQVAACGNIGAAYDFLGQPNEALIYHQKQYELAGELGDQLEQLRALNNTAGSLCSLKQTEQALTILQEAIEQGQRYDAQSSIGMSYVGRGRAYQELARYEMAAIAFERAAAIFADLENETAKTLACENARRLRDRINQTSSSAQQDMTEQRELDIYAEKLEAQLATARMRGNADTIVDLLQQLGYAQAMSERYTQALTTLNEGLELAQRMHHDVMIMKILEPLGVVYFRIDQFDQAVRVHERALTLARTLDKRYVCDLLINLGVSYRKLQQHQYAIQRLTEGMHLAYSQENDDGYLKSLIHLALAYCDLADLVQAQTFTDHTVTIAQDLDRPAEAASVVDSLVTLLIAHQCRGEALRYADLSMSLYTKAGDPFATQQADKLCIALKYTQEHPLNFFGVII